MYTILVSGRSICGRRLRLTGKILVTFNPFPTQKALAPPPSLYIRVTASTKCPTPLLPYLTECSTSRLVMVTGAFGSLAAFIASGMCVDVIR